jgi:hypothetical protein
MGRLRICRSPANGFRKSETIESYEDTRSLHEESDRLSQDRSREWGHSCGSLVVHKRKIIAEGLESVKAQMDGLPSTIIGVILASEVTSLVFFSSSELCW